MDFQFFWKFLKQFWNILNQNIISEAIGALIFGFIASFLFNKFSKTRETKEILNKIYFPLKQEIEENQKTAKRAKEIFEEEGGKSILLLPSFHLFNTSILSAISHIEFLKVMPIQQSSLVIALFNYCNRANQVYEQLNQLLKEELMQYSKITISSIGEPDYWTYLNIQTIKTHLITSLKEYLLPSIIKTCDELRFQLKDIAVV